MERQAEAKANFPPFMQKLIDGSKLEGIREGIREGELRGMREGELRGMREGELRGKLEGKRDTLLRLLARAGIAVTEGERARILECADAETLDRWVDNVLGAKTAADVLA